MFANSFPPDAEMARLTARMLLEVGAVHFRADEPYRLTSGLASPVYIDCRKLISYPRIRAALMDFACAKVLRDAGFDAFDAVAGGETAGIPFAAWIAERLGLPMLYVRKKPKGFDRDAQIEAMHEHEPAEQVTVPLAGWPTTVTEAGSSGAPVTVSLPTTLMVTGVCWLVCAVSGLAVTLFGCTVTLTLAVAQLVGLSFSQIV